MELTIKTERGRWTLVASMLAAKIDVLIDGVVTESTSPGDALNELRHFSLDLFGDKRLYPAPPDDEN